MLEKPTDTQPAPVSGPRCVVLTGDCRSAPGDLLAGLSKRGVGTVVVAEPANAMLELARRSTAALIVIEPQQQPWLIDLIQAVTRYHPRTVRWGYCAAQAPGQGQLQPLSEAVQGRSAKPPHDPAGRDDGPSHYRLSDPRSPLGRVQAQMPRERVRSLVVKVQGPTEVGEPLISEEELAMLLGPTPQQQGDD